MTPDITFISELVKHQFPAEFRSSGPNFVAFLEAYYEWMEQQGMIIHQSRTLPLTRDIDDTADQYLEYFKKKFMHSLPAELIGNQRLFQKHILELYRSKGSVAGLKLLFRLLYNEDVDLYIPSYDIFKASDGSWIEPQYIEVTDLDILWQYQGKTIRGVTSQAQATVESVEKINTGSKYVCVISLSNITGQFAVGETLIYQGLDVFDAVKIIGSPTELEIIAGSANFTSGDVLVHNDPDRTRNLQATVATTYDSVGIIDFQLVDGGNLYSLDADISITPGSNTTGIGADFYIYSLKNTETFAHNPYVIADYGSINLNATAYGFPHNPTANSSTIIEDAIEINLITVGEIASIAVTNPGTGYDGSVSISIIDPYTSTRGIQYDDGIGGQNAEVTGTSLTGTGLIGTLRVYDSGLGFNKDLEALTLIKQDDDAMNAFVKIRLGGVGHSIGYFNNTDGFLSADKFLYDGHYYQDFSYVIKSSRVVESYVDILKKTIHSAGNAIFGITFLKDAIQLDIEEQSSLVTQS